MALMFEADDYYLVSIISLWLLVSFNLEVGVVYGLMIVISWLAYYIALDRHAFQIIPIEQNKRNRWMYLVWAMGAYVGFTFLSSYVAVYIDPTMFTGSMFDVAAKVMVITFSATPILYGSKYLKLIVWGVIIPRIESIEFFRNMMQYAGRSSHFKFLKMPTSIFSTPALILAAFIGAIFALFHLVAKGITNNVALTITFLFGLMSVLLVLHFRDAVVAIFFHIITNTIATMQMLQLGFFESGSMTFNVSGVVIIVAVLSVSWFIMFFELPIPQGVLG